MSDKKRKSKPGPKDADWESIMTEYITTKVSYADLSKTHGVSLNYIACRGSEEGWVDKRKKFFEKTVAKSIEKAVNKESTRLARLMSTTTRAIEVAAKAFEDEKQFNRYLVERKEKYGGAGLEVDADTFIKETATTEEKMFQKVDTRALKELTGVLKDLTGLVREFYNLPTPEKLEAQRVAAERLELEKQKLVSGIPDGIEITITKAAESWGE